MLRASFAKLATPCLLPLSLFLAEIKIFYFPANQGDTPLQPILTFAIVMILRVWPHYLNALTLLQTV